MTQNAQSPCGGPIVKKMVEKIIARNEVTKHKVAFLMNRAAKKEYNNIKRKKVLRFNKKGGMIWVRYRRKGAVL